MNIYVLLIRGINVGGNNKVSMAELKQHLEELGFSQVTTYINSGNVIVESDKKPEEIQSQVEELLSKRFNLGDKIIKVLVLSHKQLQAVVDNKPKGFGDEPEKYYSDAIFLMDISVEEALKVFDPKEGIDKIWPGNGVIYSQRLGAERIKSRLNKIIGTVPYKSMTIRNWTTTTKLLKMFTERY